MPWYEFSNYEPTGLVLIFKWKLKCLKQAKFVLNWSEYNATKTTTFSAFTIMENLNVKHDVDFSHGRKRIPQNAGICYNYNIL